MKTLEQAYQDFDLQQVIQQQLVGTPEAVNAYVECCERYTGSNRIALYWQGKDGQKAEYSFDQLAQASGQLANYFKS